MDVTFDDRLPADKPFAALRSMYIAESNADAARIAWTTPGYTGVESVAGHDVRRGIGGRVLARADRRRRSTI